ncbi:MAG: ATP-binding protein, partial [Lachnospiraceae bacterium]|nr:ATP-binding protein [Lachnospiraceae bacterium]
LMAAPKIMINTNNGYFDHPLGDHYKELKTVLTTKELSYLINFPLRSVPGISVIDSTPEFSLNQQEEVKGNAIEFGKLLYGGSLTNMSYKIPTDVLSRHTLLSGINGSGKTNTVQAILNNLQDIPFLVIEPAKTEYVDWAIEYNKKHPENPIDIYIPGCKKYKNGFVPKPLKLNPFQLVWLNQEQEPNVLTHIDRLKSTFAAAFPMYDILPVLMEDLIYTVYQNKSTNWLSEEPKFGITLPPTLNSMSVTVDKVISNRQYEERIERNMKACLNTRIDSLKRGWKGEMLNTVHSTPWKDLFEKPCITNLSYVGDDVDKSFFMALILQFLYEYRAACAEIGEVDFNDNGCKHLTVIEEAHRVMAKCDNQELPQYKSAMMFSNMLSEIRAYGEGLFLVDQVPTRLIPDAIKNTNLKITHRLVAEDDCKAIGESMGLSEEQRKVISKLLTGQCIVSSSLATDTYWIKADKVK